MNPGFSLADSQDLKDFLPMRNQESFPPLSDLSKHSIGINGPNVARIILNFECNQFFILVGAGVTVESIGTHNIFNLNVWLNI